MTYTLIIWLFSQNIVIERDYHNLAMCERYQAKAAVWASVAVCQRKTGHLIKDDPLRQIGEGE